MNILFLDEGIGSPPLVFHQGVAAVDMITLRRAGEAIAQLGYEVRLPRLADTDVPGVFDALCRVAVRPGPAVTATIDTSKMRWTTEDVRQSEFTDYRGDPRYGVRFGRTAVARVGDATVARVPTVFGDDTLLDLWFAELPEASLGMLGYYELYALAATLTTRVQDGTTDGVTACDQIIVPAQQISWGRAMSEITAANPAVRDVRQEAFVALDETGVRVKVQTMIRGMAAHTSTEQQQGWEFGAHGPVQFWLTGPGSATPCAVIATTADAWLEPDARVTFDDAAFRG